MIIRISSAPVALLLLSFAIACGPPAADDAGPDADVDAGANPDVDSGPNPGVDAGPVDDPPFDAGPAAEWMPSVAGGSFVPLAGYEASAAAGAALLVRSATGTRVSVQVGGLTPNATYPGHVHALPCAINAAGGHYKKDPTIADAAAGNELWVQIVADASGDGWVETTTDHIARGEALSVVMHDAANANAKMLCADLKLTDDATNTSWGLFWPFAASEAVDDAIRGTAELTRSPTGTTVELDVHGLDPTATYGSHVHAYACDVNDAGGHYKIDPTIDVTDANNELWPALTPDTSGNATATLTVSHVARGDAQSVVIHRVLTDGAPKVACADLVRGESLSFAASGTGVNLPAATTNGHPNLATSGDITRTAGPDSTVVNLTVSGLAATTAYGAHLHARACAIADGGGHYKRDPNVVATEETNEVWLPFTTDATGAGTGTITVAHMVRAGGQSIVVHDVDATRLTCLDLK